MKLFSKKDLILLGELVDKENQEYYKKQNTKYNSDLDKRNKAINNVYKILKKFYINKSCMKLYTIQLLFIFILIFFVIQIFYFYVKNFCEI